MAAKDNTANDALPSINQQYSAMSANPVKPENRIPDTPDGKWRIGFQITPKVSGQK